MNPAFANLLKIVTQGSWGYHLTGPRASEPAAFACLALHALGERQEAGSLADWLADLQKPAGSVGITQEQETPAWPTSLAMLAWQASDLAAETDRYATARQQALDWALQTHGKAIAQQGYIGHDMTLVGWSWAAATHSWLEPTCMFVLALKASGQGEHPRTREAVRLLIDRQLELGGCNYGNTRVLGQATLPHIQPTGLAMLALAGEPIDDPRVERSLDYLENVLNEETATSSLCFGLLGLTAHGRRPANADALLEHSFQRGENLGTLNCYRLALLTLAGQEDLSWLPQSQSSPAPLAINS